MKVRKLEVLGAGLAAAVVIACGDAAMNGAGGMLGDAGEMMSDAGQTMMDAGAEMMRDAGVVMMDAGGEMMRDAGEIVRDAGEVVRDAGEVMRDGSTGMMDTAVAQSCEACTASGRQMVVTADADIEQLRGGTVEGEGWSEVVGATYPEAVCPTGWSSRVHTKALIDGPFVLTDYRSSNNVDLFTVPSGAACQETFNTSAYPSCPSAGGGTVQVFRRPSAARSISFDVNALTISGARLLIAEGETLCAFETQSLAGAVSEPRFGASSRLVWSGFVPYE